MTTSTTATTTKHPAAAAPAAPAAQKIARYQDQVIQLRLSSRVKDRLARAARAREQHMSEFMRLAIIAEITRVEQSGELAAATGTDGHADGRGGKRGGR